MSIYRVGGWVRDTLLGYEPKDNDFVVTGETVEQFLEQWEPDRYHVAEIGKSFPVFLVVDCQQNWKGEFAVARRERKVGVGHNAFTVEADPSITLLDDLRRRDLTCNAIALPHVHRNNLPLESQVIDPFGGVADIRAGVLRHVGPAFAEDPLRVFRLARFAAQFDWQVHPTTVEIAAGISDTEISSLSAEHVGNEFMRAMGSKAPWRFIEVLETCDKLRQWFPELARLRQVPAGPPEHHGEGDALEHTLMALRALPKVAQLWGDLVVATLLHDLGKGVTPEDRWPAHHGHDEAGVPLVEALCDRLKLPNRTKASAAMVCREHMRVHAFLEFRRKGKWVDIVKAADRCSVRAEGLSRACWADANGRVPAGGAAGADALLVAAVAARGVSGQPIPDNLTGANRGLHVRRVKGDAVRRELIAGGFLPTRK